MRYKLPLGQSTSSIEEYIRQWDNLTGPIAKELNLQAIGYGEGVSFRSKETNKFFSCDTWLALRLYRSITKKEFDG